MEEEEIEEDELQPEQSFDERNKKYFPSERNLRNRNFGNKKLEQAKKRKTIMDRVMGVAKNFYNSVD